MKSRDNMLNELKWLSLLISYDAGNPCLLKLEPSLYWEVVLPSKTCLLHLYCGKDDCEVEIMTVLCSVHHVIVRHILDVK